MDRRKSLARWCEEQIGKRFRDEDGRAVKFRTTISTAAAIDRAAYQGQTVLQSEPKHRVSAQYRALAREVEARIATQNARCAHGKAAANG